MREGMACDLVASPMQLYDLSGADTLPVAAPFIHQTARHVERCFGIVLVENGDAVGGRAFRKIVEGKADHRPFVAQPEWRQTEVSRQTVANARVQCLLFGLLGHPGHPIRDWFLVKRPACARKDSRSSCGT